MPPEFAEIVKALGIPGGAAVAVFYLWLTRTPAKSGKSELEEDVKAILAKLEENQMAIHKLDVRVAHIEGRIERRSE